MTDTDSDSVSSSGSVEDSDPEMLPEDSDAWPFTFTLRETPRGS